VGLLRGTFHLLFLVDLRHNLLVVFVLYLLLGEQVGSGRAVVVENGARGKESGVLLEPLCLLVIVLEFHALHALELHQLRVVFGPDEIETLEVVPLSADLALEHISLALVWLLADTEDAAL